MTAEKLTEVVSGEALVIGVMLVILVLLLILHKLNRKELERLEARVVGLDAELGRLRRVGQTNVRPGRVEPPGVRFTPSDRVGKHPAKFYSIVPNDDGTVDVYFPLQWAKYEADGATECDLTVSAMRGVVPWDGLEEDIRAHYDDWVASGVRITL